MDEFERPAPRQSVWQPVLAALFLGAVFGGGLASQGESLDSLSADWRQVLDAPALGGSAASAPTWTPREDPAKVRAELEKNLTAPWPQDRMMVVPEEAGQAPAAPRAPEARPASAAVQKPISSAVPADWRRHLIPVWHALPQSVRSSAYAAAAAIQESQAAAPAAAPRSSPSARTAGRPASAAPIHYALAARGAVLSAGAGSAMNLMGGRLR